MKKYVLKIILSLLLAVSFVATPITANAVVAVKGATALTGGGSGSLDSFDGATLNDGDVCFVFYGTSFYFYKLNATSGAAENSPAVISPDTSAGNKRWILQDNALVSDTAYAGSWDGVTGYAPSKNAVYDQMQLKLTGSYASAAEELAGIESAKASSPSVSRELIINLKPVVNAAVNKLDIFSKSGGAVPDATNPIKAMIPDGNGYTFRSRATAYLSGTSQFIMADAANYWSKGSLDAEIKTAYVYAIWDANGGIVWALGGYSGFTRVPASTTSTDDDFLLLEENSTYTKVITDYCVCVGKIRYQYDTADTPDHTIQATVLNAPLVIWNPKSDYGYSKALVIGLTQASDIVDYSVVSLVVKQSRKYRISWHVTATDSSILANIITKIKTGSATYGSAVLNSSGYGHSTAVSPITIHITITVYLNAGDTIHGGAAVAAASGNRTIYGDDAVFGITALTFSADD